MFTPAELLVVETLSRGVPVPSRTLLLLVTLLVVLVVLVLVVLVVLVVVLAPGHTLLHTPAGRADRMQRLACLRTQLLKSAGRHQVFLFPLAASLFWELQMEEQ
jgi:hypothetical protein